MRWIGIVAVALAVGAAGMGSAVGSPTKASLKLSSRQPLAVQGLHFLAGERVRVQVTGDDTGVRRVRASQTGSFTAKFDDVGVARCNTIRVVATGNSGSTATLKMLPSPACLPA